MLKHLLPTVLLVTGFSLPVVAQPPVNQPQTQPTSEELYQACTQNRAETLPNPFTDVPANHWAFKAVLTMHYCGAFRQAAPRSLFERSPNPQTSPQSATPATPANSQLPSPKL